MIITDPDKIQVILHLLWQHNDESHPHSKGGRRNRQTHRGEAPTTVEDHLPTSRLAS